MSSRSCCYRESCVYADVDAESPPCCRCQDGNHYSDRERSVRRSVMAPRRHLPWCSNLPTPPRRAH